MFWVNLFLFIAVGGLLFSFIEIHTIQEFVFFVLLCGLIILFGWLGTYVKTRLFFRGPLPQNFETLTRIVHGTVKGFPSSSLSVFGVYENRKVTFTILGHGCYLWMDLGVKVKKARSFFLFSAPRLTPHTSFVGQRIIYASPALSGFYLVAQKDPYSLYSLRFVPYTAEEIKANFLEELRQAAELAEAQEA